MKRIIVALITLFLVACTSSGAGAQDSKKVLFLGTSTTEGMGATPVTSRFVDLVKAAKPSNTYTVLGRGGTMLVHTDPAKSWEQTIIPSGHDVVIMQFGLNEWNMGVPTMTFREQATAFVARVRIANPSARLVWLSPWIPQYVAQLPDARGNLWQEHGMAIEAALRTVQGEHLDMDPTGSRRLAAPYSFGGADGLHYNNAGHRKLADAVLTKI